MDLRRLTCPVTLAAAILLSGCASERKVLRSEPSLTAEALESGGLAVIGVTMVDEVEQIRPPLLTAFEHALEAGRPDLVVVTAGSVRDRVGASAYRRILNAYQQTGKLSVADGAELDSALEGTARYAVLARVEKAVIHGETHGLLHVSTRSGNTYGQVQSNVGTRSARVRVTMFDLHDRREVLAIIYASSSENAPPDTVWSLPHRPVVPEPGTAPEPRFDSGTGPPDLAETLREGFARFVSELPR